MASGGRRPFEVRAPALPCPLHSRILGMIIHITACILPDTNTWPRAAPWRGSQESWCSCCCQLHREVCDFGQVPSLIWTSWRPWYGLLGFLQMVAYQCTWWGVTPGNRGRWTGPSSQLQALLLIWAMSGALLLVCEMWPEGAHDVAWCITEACIPGTMAQTCLHRILCLGVGWWVSGGMAGSEPQDRRSCNGHRA